MEEDDTNKLEDYENIKSYFKEIISKQTEKIVLIKKKL